MDRHDRHYLWSAVEDADMLRVRHWMRRNKGRIQPRPSDGSTLEKKQQVQAKAELQAGFCLAIRHDEKKIFRYLLEMKADIHGTPNRVPLIEAAACGNAKLCSELLEAKASVNAGNVRLSTPLMYAAGRVRLSVVQILMAHGADPAARDDWGKSAIDYAASTDELHTPQIMALLLPAPQAPSCPYMDMLLIASQWKAKQEAEAEAERQRRLFLDTPWSKKSVLFAAAACAFGFVVRARSRVHA